MARPWESALHFEPTINCLTLHPVFPECFAPGVERRLILLLLLLWLLFWLSGSFRLRVLLLFWFTILVRLRVLLLVGFIGFGVPSSFGVGWLFFLVFFGLL